MKKIIGIFGIILLVISACSETNSPSENFGKIKIRVMNVKDNLPLSNALISTEPASESITSDSIGEYLLDNLKPGNYKVIAEKLGFSTNSVTVNVLENKTVHANIFLYDDSFNNNLPDKPVLLTPSNNAVLKKLTTNLSWSCLDKDDDELSFTVFLDTSNPPVKMVANDIGLTSIKIDDLISDNTYYWYVVAKDKYGIGPKSSVYSFKIDTNSSIVPEDNLILYLPFENNFNDLSKSNLQTICSNQAYSKGRDGQENGSFAFLSKNTITVKDSYVIDFTNNFSVSFWINPNNGFGFDILEDVIHIVGRAGGTGPNASSWFIELYKDGNMIFGTYNTTDGSSRPKTNKKIEIGKWTHVCAVYSNSTIKIYMNGELDLQTYIPPPQPSIYDLHVGGRVITGNRYFNGYMDDLKIYNKVLTSNEVMSLYNE